MGWTTLGIGLLVALTALLLLSQRKRETSPARSRVAATRGASRASAAAAAGSNAAPATATSLSPWASVSIRTGSAPCAAAEARQQARFLESAAPTLPLPDCDRASCGCSFERHDDRRRNEVSERRLGVGLKSELYGANGEPERRLRRGRRKTDHS